MVDRTLVIDPGDTLTTEIHSRCLIPSQLVNYSTFMGRSCWYCAGCFIGEALASVIGAGSSAAQMQLQVLAGMGFAMGMVLHPHSTTTRITIGR